MVHGEGAGYLRGDGLHFRFDLTMNVCAREVQHLCQIIFFGFESVRKWRVITSTYRKMDTNVHFELWKKKWCVFLFRICVIGGVNHYFLDLEQKEGFSVCTIWEGHVFVSLLDLLSLILEVWGSPKNIWICDNCSGWEKDEQCQVNLLHDRIRGIRGPKVFAERTESLSNVNIYLRKMSGNHE